MLSVCVVWCVLCSCCVVCVVSVVCVCLCVWCVCMCVVCVFVCVECVWLGATITLQTYSELEQICQHEKERNIANTNGNELAGLYKK